MKEIARKWGLRSIAWILSRSFPNCARRSSCSPRSRPSTRRAAITPPRLSTPKNGQFSKSSVQRSRFYRLRPVIRHPASWKKFADPDDEIGRPLSRERDGDVRKLPIAILGSGKGSNCRAILERVRTGQLEADVRVVISDAREFSVPGAYLPPGRFRTRLEPEAELRLVQMLRDAGAALIVLAGFMRVLKAPMLEAFPRRIVKIHPSLLPKFPG